MRCAQDSSHNVHLIKQYAGLFPAQYIKQCAQYIQAMTLHKRGNIYWYKFIRDGVPYQASTKCTRRADAELIENAEKVRVAQERVGIQTAKRVKVPRFEMAMRSFLEWCEVEHAEKPATTRRYQVSSRSLLEYFKQILIDRIDSSAVEDFKDWRRVQKALPKQTKSQKSKKKQKPTSQIKPATVNREMACLKAMFTYWIRKKAILVNPVSDVKMLQEEPSYHVITVEEERAYFQHASDPLYDIAGMILETGMRPEEVCAMRFQNVRLKEEFYFNPMGKTSSARRRVPLTKRAQEIILRRLEMVDGEFLFPGRVEGRHIVKVNAAHTAAIRRAKLGAFRIYDFRHTFATRFVEAGGDLVTLAQILGHADLRMVMIYSHPTDLHKIHSIKKMEAYNHSRRKNAAETATTILTTKGD